MAKAFSTQRMPPDLDNSTAGSHILHMSHHDTNTRLGFEFVCVCEFVVVPTRLQLGDFNHLDTLLLIKNAKLRAKASEFPGLEHSNTHALHTHTQNK